MTFKAIIFHGTNCTPDDFWYHWLAGQLQARGYEVAVPHYPQINQEPVTDTLQQVLRNHVFDEHTILIGHSSGAVLLLALLQAIDVTVPQAIFVAGFSPHALDLKHMPILQTIYNWDKIRRNAKEFIFINSIDDPWGCDDTEGRALFDKLGGTLVICNEGHFGSAKFGQPYPTFELLERLVK